MPFAVVGSNTVVESSGRKVRGRIYPWGVVEGKYSKTCTDTKFLANFLITGSP